MKLYEHTIKDAPEGKSLFNKYDSPSAFISALNKVTAFIHEEIGINKTAPELIAQEVQDMGAGFAGFDQPPTPQEIAFLEREGYKDQKQLNKAVKASKKLPQISLPQVSEEVTFQEQGLFVDVAQYIDLMSDEDNDAYFFNLEEREEIQTPYLHLHVGIGYNGGLSAEEGLFNGIATAVLSSILEDAGYSVTVTAHRYALRVVDDLNAHFCITAKTAFQRVNLHKLAFITSDTRFFRTYGFLAARVGAYEWGKVSFEKAKAEILKHYNQIKENA